jgi:hypothetical protein
MVAIFRSAVVVGTTLACAIPAIAHDPATESRVTSEQQFETISALEGDWQVKESASLKIVFEPTAGGSVIIEKWMRGERTHSLTLYHLDGGKLLATHYCPQGNQPRMAGTLSNDGTIRFAFQDATDLDPTESYQHDLSLHQNADGTLSRAEIYWGPEGAGEQSTLTLVRVEE